MFSIDTFIDFNTTKETETNMANGAVEILLNYLGIKKFSEIGLLEYQVQGYLQRNLDLEEASVVRVTMENHLFGVSPTDQQLSEFYTKLDQLKNVACL